MNTREFVLRDEIETIFRRIMHIFITVRPRKRRLSPLIFLLFHPRPPTDCDQVYPNIYLGNASAAKNRSYLASLGITHVLNAAHGNRSGRVNTGAVYYHNTRINYMGLNLDDLPSQRIFPYFQQSANFIHRAITSGGKVLVHCVMGISRSATIVCAYLMIKQGMNIEEALTTLRSARLIRPNDGFLYELIILEKYLSNLRTPLPAVP
ncbi:dual specificity protein phosphatase 13-like [Centruroides sculpturatus]|uniref:dual specificity protein phosphatase 13-like n=1 Tax=Centruroides sculpturatus TaxID=218467 RepID=UPI000C6E58E2|nr:dual specificity protein phosphatase 13-like [Centruroides sculpturatus]